MINPLAGLGGAVALKGSDGAETVEKARALGAESRVAARVETCLAALEPRYSRFDVFTVAGAMGDDICQHLGISAQVVYTPDDAVTTPEDTRAAIASFAAEGVDLVLFAGGDGTARDVFDAVGEGQAVLGIPCGVKMHSGVFANNPTAATRILEAMIDGKLVSVIKGEVRDIDEASFRSNIVKTRFYGEMWVPAELRYLQQVKSGGKEVEALAVQEIAAEIVEQMEPGTTYFVGSGSTTAAINESLGLESTLLGVDVVRDGELLKVDATEQDLLAFAEKGPCQIVVTAIGGQGHIFGRGNQQLSAKVLRAVSIENITLIATKSKLEALEGKPLLVDTGDPALDRELAGTMRVVTGYEDAVLYPVEG